MTQIGTAPPRASRGPAAAGGGAARRVTAARDDGGAAAPFRRMWRRCLPIIWPYLVRAGRSRRLRAEELLDRAAHHGPRGAAPSRPTHMSYVRSCSTIGTGLTGGPESVRYG